MKSLAKHGMLAAICLALALSGCGGKKTGDGKDGDKGGGATLDQSSPEKVAESFKKAAKDKDWKTMFACLTPESQKTLIGGLMLGAAFSTFGDKTKKESLEELMKKHGIDPKKKPGMDEDPTAGIKDTSALFGDLVEFLEKNRTEPKGGKPRKSFSEQFSSVELTNFKTDGDTATADVMEDGKKKGEPAEFKKVDGKWYVHFESRQKGAPKFPKTKG